MSKHGYYDEVEAFKKVLGAVCKLIRKKEILMAKATFTVVLTVEPAVVPLAVKGQEDLGAVGETALKAAGLEISGGTPPYSVVVQDVTALPPGVTVNPDGTFAGLPTVAGSYTVVVEVADSLG